MSRMRSEVSEKNVYYLEKHRYYELMHFCLQYNSWKEECARCDGISRPQYEPFADVKRKTCNFGNPTEKCAVTRAFYSRRMDMVKQAAEETDEVIGKYIFKAVTNGLSYDILNAADNIPCCRGTYYTLYRRFFWLLSQKRG